MWSRDPEFGIQGSGNARRRSLMNPKTRYLNPSSGFTLVETSVVVVIMGLIMMTVFPTLNAVRVANQSQLTQSNLRSLMVATAAYVQANGCLPCPANPATVGSNFGRMNYASPTTSCGTCSTPEGIVPFASLGIPAPTAHDGWGHWITMRVDPALTTAFGVVPPTAVCTSADVSGGICSQVGISAKGLCKTGLATSNRINVTIPNGPTQQAAVIFVSFGANGYGSFFAQATAQSSNGSILPFSSQYTSCAGGSYALCNAAQTKQFYDAPQTNVETNPYDDQLIYADRNSLVAMFGNGSCQTVW